ncbi:transcriptional activator FtrA [Leminorella grimontii]|nr:transcriptional activator FtrA [Leminorella grimontii]
MSVPSVAVVATDGFSPFHFSVPCTIFGSILPDQKLYNLLICAQAPGPVRSTMGLTLTAEHGLEALEKSRYDRHSLLASPRRKASSGATRCAD